MISSDVLGRVYCLRAADEIATGFAIDFEGRQYLVTAKHFGSKVTSLAPLEILFEQKWHNLGAGLVGHAEGEIDISVFAFSGLVARPELLLAPDQAIIYGQDVYFLGFPLGSWGSSETAFANRPLPFVRRALVSCIESSPGGAHRNFLAGHNVQGFSGGPVVYSFTPPRNFKVTSVISGYRYSQQPIFMDSIESGMTYRENSGTIISYGIRHALDIISANPIGCPIGS